MKAVLKGVERALNQQERRPQWNAHRQGDKRIGEINIVSSIETDGSNGTDDRFGEHDHGGGEEHDEQATLFSALTRSCRASSRFAAAMEREILGNIAVDTDTAMSE